MEGVQSQVQNRWEWVIPYNSKALNEAEMTVTQWEVLIIMGDEDAGTFPLVPICTGVAPTH
jgi:ABC-type sugar transport system ATPase subunit